MADSALDLFNRVGQVDDKAQELGIRPELLHAVMRQESGGQSGAVSPKGAVGAMQVMPATARNPGFGVKPFNPANPDENLHGSASYLQAMLHRYNGDESKALAAYNAGPGAVDHAGGVPNFPETQHYVKTILGHAQSAQPAASTSALDLFNSADGESPADQAKAQAEDGVTRFVKGAWQNLNPVAAVKGLAQMASDPKKAYHSMVDASANQFTKAKADYDAGHYSEMVGHGLAGALPMVGPAAADAGETIASGDVAGGLGQAAGLVGSMVAPELAGKLVKGAGNVASNAAERVIRSNVKPDMSLVARNPGQNIARTILDEKFKPGAAGRDQALGLTKDLSNQVTELNAADTATGAKYGLGDLEKALEAKRAHYLQSPAGAGDVAAIDSALSDLRNHPLYSKAQMGPGPDVATQVPHPTAVDAQGRPIMQTQMLPGPDVEVGRQLVPQSASTIDAMKRGIYEENPKAYGERKGASVEGDKAQGRALKGILDQNVDGVKDINARQSNVIVARKALGKMAEREANKYPLGLMDLAAGGTAALGAAVNPLLGVPPVIAALLKHPTTAFPIARGMDAVGKATRAVAPVVKAGGLAGVAGRGVQMAEAKRLYQTYLDSQPK